MIEKVCCVCGEYSCSRHDQREHERLTAEVLQTRKDEEAGLYEQAKWHWDRLGYWDSQPWYDTAQECWDYESHKGAWSAQ